VRENKVTPQAVRDLTAIADYVREHSPQASLRIRASILESIDILSAFPKAGRLQSTPGVRKLVTRRYAYLVYYTVEEVRSEVLVLSIKHPAREREHEDR
jgi:toxin ParE1/3/4